MGTKRKELKRLNDIHSNMLDKVLCQTAPRFSRLCFSALHHAVPSLCQRYMCYSSSAGLAKFQSRENMQIHYQQHVCCWCMAKMHHCKVPFMQHLCNVDHSRNVWYSLGTAHGMVVHLCRHQQLVLLLGSWEHSSSNACAIGVHGGLCLTVSDAYRLGSR